jgi:hypothetical protein
MIRIFILFSFFICVTANAQIDNYVYIAALSNVHRAEDNRLDDIEERQMLLTSATTAMSVSSVLMANTESKLHAGLVRVYDLIENAEVILQIVKTSQEIMQIQDRILEHALQYPEVMPIAASYEVVWMLKASNVLLQLLLATQESKFNLMSGAQRLMLLHNTADALKEIQEETWVLYRQIEGYSAATVLEQILPPLTIDFTEVITNAEERINNLVIE